MTEQKEKETEDLVPCIMYKLCDGYESYLCESKEFRSQCRKLDDYFFDDGDKR